MNGAKLSRNHNRHPGAGRDPELSLVGSFLDSGLGFGFLRHSTSSIPGVVRRNDEKYRLMP